MSELQKLLNEIKTSLINGELEEGSAIIKLIAALEKAIEQRDDIDTSFARLDDAELLNILKGDL